MNDLEAGWVLEAPDVSVLDALAPDGAVELLQGILGVGALQVVALAEQRRVAAAHGGLTVVLAARDGAEAGWVRCVLGRGAVEVRRGSEIGG